MELCVIAEDVLPRQIAPIVLRYRKNSFEPMVECVLVQPNCELILVLIKYCIAVADSLRGYSPRTARTLRFILALKVILLDQLQGIICSVIQEP